VFWLRSSGHGIMAKLAAVSLVLLVPIAPTAIAQLEVQNKEEIQARKAAEFVDSMGINIHMEYNTTLPYRRYEAINQRLKLLGMRHFRDEINHADPFSPLYDRSFIDELHRIGGLGYSLCGLIEGGDDYPPLGATLGASHVVPMIRGLQPMIDAVEGPNEPDDPSDPPFTYGVDELLHPQGAMHESEDLWNIVKSRQQTSLDHRDGLSQQYELSERRGTARSFAKSHGHLSSHCVPQRV
jgi:hypothetical protein